MYDAIKNSMTSELRSIRKSPASFKDDAFARVAIANIHALIVESDAETVAHQYSGRQKVAFRGIVETKREKHKLERNSNSVFQHVIQGEMQHEATHISIYFQKFCCQRTKRIETGAER